MAEVLLELSDIEKSYSSGDEGRITILNGISFVLKEGEAMSIEGRSGSGKSTLLSIAALLIPQDKGKVLYGGVDASSFNEKEKARLRNEGMGFVFQDSLLLEDFSALENVAMPLLIRGMKKKEAYDRAGSYLALCKIDNRASHRPSQLSGGERQRAAIARALASEATIIFADEPTGSLDEKSADRVEDLLLDATKGEKRALLLVTHSPSFAAKADVRFTLQSGELQ